MDKDEKPLVTITIGGSNRKYSKQYAALEAMKAMFTMPIRTRMGGKTFRVTCNDTPELREWAEKEGIKVKPYKSFTGWEKEL